MARIRNKQFTRRPCAPRKRSFSQVVGSNRAESSVLLHKRCEITICISKSWCLKVKIPWSYCYSESNSNENCNGRLDANNLGYQTVFTSNSAFSQVSTLHQKTLGFVFLWVQNVLLWPGNFSINVDSSTNLFLHLGGNGETPAST